LDVKTAMELDKEMQARGHMVAKLFNDPEVQRILKEKMIELFVK
jgi:hypothetical protein